MRFVMEYVRCYLIFARTSYPRAKVQATDRSSSGSVQNRELRQEVAKTGLKPDSKPDSSQGAIADQPLAALVPEAES